MSLEQYVLTNFHEKKNAPPTGGHVFQATGTNFQLVQNFIATNLLTKFHDDRTINIASRVLTRKHATPPWRPYIIGTNHLTKFHDDRTINVASRVLTRKNAPLPNIIRTNLLTKFHEDLKINVASRVLTRKNALPPGSHVFQPTSIIFELVQDIIGVNLLTKFHEDRTINVASRVINAPSLGSHVFQANVTIFELIQYIIETKLPTKFHEDWTIYVTSRVRTALPPGGHVFSPIWTIFELFHDDWAKIVTSREYCPPPGGHLDEDWASNVTSTVFTSFELSRGINGTNTINVASRVFTRQNVDDARRTTHDGQKAITKAHHEHLSSDNHLVDGPTDRRTDRQT
ncbi:hypothetical protein DPMN_120767 [Dreissena polymorpha]|uniref:Uncharacterized protein n=1 Tax=Dreissena polymorpha TaxID=45954 RepID=A0A9D4JSZ9_DREPO|nr:hypothetical protein DPMN_120767 [Dreissena polymorpha]